MGRKKTAKIIDFTSNTNYFLNKNNLSEVKSKEKNMKQNKNLHNRKKNKKKKKIKVSGKLILFIMLILTICAVCLFTPSFNINSIKVVEVNGEEYVDPLIYDEENIEETAEKSLDTEEINNNNTITQHYTKQEIIDMSQIIIGTNIFKINLNNIEKNIEDAPYIKNVTIKRVLPSTIKIEIEERVIKAYVDYIGAYMCIDETGYCVDSIKKGENRSDIPIIRGINPSNSEKGFDIGEKLDADDSIKLQRVTNLLNLIDKNELNLNIKEIDVTDKDNVTIIINNGDIKINFGDMSNMNVKVPFLPEILKDKEGKKGTIQMNSNSDNIQPIFSEIIGG